MAPTIPNSIKKNWLSQQIRHAKSLKTEAGKERFWDNILEGLEEVTKPKTVRQPPVSRSIPVVLFLIFSHLVNCKQHDFGGSVRDLQPERCRRMGLAFA
jgi:hypothetical protein